MEDIEKRFIELSNRASERYYTTYTDFLNMDDQSILKNTCLSTPVCLYGGYDMAERCLAGFGDECEINDFPISYIKIEPLNKKFSDNLNHRDFLGSLMGLGIKRETLGDIIIDENVGYLICLENMVNYIIENLKKVRHTSVKCSVIEKLPKTAIKEPEDKKIIVSSKRLDVLIAGVYNLSRSEVKELFVNRKIFVNSKLCENFSEIAKSDDVISVRGFGKFIYEKEVGNTKKNRLLVNVKIYC